MGFVFLALTDSAVVIVLFNLGEFGCDEATVFP